MDSSFSLLAFAGFAASINAAWTAILLLLCENFLIKVKDKLPDNHGSLVTIRMFMQQNTAHTVITKLFGETLLLYIFLEAFVWYAN